MKLQPRQPHVSWRSRGGQPTQDQTQPFRVLRLDPGLGAGREERRQPLVPESSHHRAQCNRSRYAQQDAQRPRQPATAEQREAAVGFVAKSDHGSRADQHRLKESAIDAPNVLEPDRAHQCGDPLDRDRQIAGLQDGGPCV